MSTTNRRGEFRVLGADQLHTIHTNWELVESYEVEVPQIVHDESLNPQPQQPYGYHQATIKLARNVLTRRREFLFFLPADAVESETAASLRSTQERLRWTLEENASTLDTLAKKENELGAAKERDAAQAKRIDDLLSSVATHRDAAAKMERDIAKLTKALGEVRMREILTEAK